MSAPKYVYQDEDGVALTVNPYPHAHAGDIAAVSTRGTVYVLPEHFREVAAGLWAGAGLPPPVILDRPEIVSDGDGETGVNIFTVRLEPHFKSVSIRYHGAPAAAVIAPGPARLLASVIAAYADAAEGESDPAEVEELTAVLWDAMKGGPAETAARAALKWMRGKQQREEDRP